MKQLTLAAIIAFVFAVSVQAKGKKVDWSLCDHEIKTHCSRAKSDHEKHECIEKLPKEKVSDECREKNEKLEGTFSEHKHDH